MPTLPVPPIRDSRTWRRVLKTVLAAAILWWLGAPLFYYVWASSAGAHPRRDTEFAQLHRVLPPVDARLTSIYAGLPHHNQDGQLLYQLFTASHRKIGSYRFHAMPVAATEALGIHLHEALRSPGLYRPFTGPKLCGGFHPDYCFEWQSTKGWFHALLCLGCHEMILIGPDAELYCNLSDEPSVALRELLDGLKQTK